MATVMLDMHVRAQQDALQQHCPDNIRVDHITVERTPMRFDQARRVVITVTRDGNPTPITFWTESDTRPGHHWFPYRMILAKIGLLA